MPIHSRSTSFAILAASTLILGCARSPEEAASRMSDPDASALATDSAVVERYGRDIAEAYTGDIAEAYGDDVARDLERVRAVTEKFKDITVAHAAGYPTRVPGCLDNPPEGGMGMHYMHPDLLNDDQLNVERPEILVYAPTPGGEPNLVGVEYYVPFSIRGPDEEAPRIFGRSLKPGNSFWYLHVWAWESNTNGLFADWNPAVKC